jgi:hypothetical protein
VFSVPENPGSHQTDRAPKAAKPQVTRLGGVQREVAALFAATIAWWHLVDAAGRQIHGRRYVPGSAQIAHLTRLLVSDSRRLKDAAHTRRQPRPTTVRIPAGQWVQL